MGRKLRKKFCNRCGLSAPILFRVNLTTGEQQEPPGLDRIPSPDELRRSNLNLVGMLKL